MSLHKVYCLGCFLNSFVASWVDSVFQMFVGVMVVFPCVYWEVIECLVGGGSHLVEQCDGFLWLIFEQRKDKGFSQS